VLKAPRPINSWHANLQPELPARGIGRIFVGASPKGSRVIRAFKAVFFGLFRNRSIFGLIRCPVVIPKVVSINKNLNQIYSSYSKSIKEIIKIKR
jgi:hypothetical protein